MSLPDKTSLVCEKCGVFNCDNGILVNGKFYCENCREEMEALVG